jgi:cyclic pyranopterin phosphate synthase
MPEEGIVFERAEDLLSTEEILRLARILSARGVSKIRITGGEPFVRRDLPEILKGISPHFRSINVTTNASLLHRALDILDIPNLGSLNISLDSLNPMTFLAITKRDRFEVTWDNIMACYNKGFRIKLNMVVMKGINDHEIPDFLELARLKDIDVRFIEAMPFNGYDHNNGLFMDHNDILEVIQAAYPGVKEHYNIPQKSASIRYDIPGFKGRVGIIPAFSRTLCGTCNRIRITAKGQLMSCLYSTNGLDLMPLLRSTHSDEDIALLIQEHLWNKPKNGFEAEREGRPGDQFQSMTTIGG